MDDANRRGNVEQAEASKTIKKIHSSLRKELKNGEYERHQFIHSVTTSTMTNVFTLLDL